MTYVAYHETRSAAQQAADAESDRMWMESHKIIASDDTAPAIQYRPAVAFDAIPSAH